MTYELHAHTAKIADTAKVLCDLRDLICQINIGQLWGEYDIDISIIPRPTAK